jgi:signal transduction histidine kinase
MSSGHSEMTGPRRFIRRIDVRLTAWFSLVLLLTSVALFGLTMWNLYRTLLNDDRGELQSRVLGHWARFQAAASEESGITQLVNDIQTETMELGDKPYFVRIATSDNNDVFLRIPLVEWHIAFDLEALFEGNEPHSSGFITLSSEILGYDLEVIGFPLSKNYVIQIGMDTEARMHITRLFRTSFFLTFAVLFGVSVLGGLLFTSRSLSPIGSLSSAIRTIIETGKLDQRIPRVGGGDDLDDLVVSFNHMLDRVEQLVRGMRDALDAVAHDLRTPMTRFRATAESALSGKAEVGVYVDALGDALEESDQILRMLDSMMDISEAEAGVMSLRREEMDLSQLITDVIDIYSLVTEEAGVHVVSDLSPGLTVSADPGRLRQAVGNLVDNAVKYSRPGATVSLALRTAEHLPKSHDAGAFAEICVKNEGEGISAADLPHIWTRLYRGDEGRRSSGLGLGLTLVRAIVEAHGGQVAVDSESGRYAEFRIYFPLAAHPGRAGSSAVGPSGDPSA